MSSFALLDSQFGEENKVQQPRSARATRGHHRFDGTIVNNKVVGYVPVVYEHQEYPRMLFHPQYGMEKKPDMAKFAIGCVTAEQFQQAFQAFQEAEHRWLRGNRVKLVQLTEAEKALPEKHQLALLKKREADLLEKGWLPKPPLRTENPAFDQNSDEI